MPCNTKYSCDNQGVQPGWSDIYSNDLDCQVPANLPLVVAALTATNLPRPLIIVVGYYRYHPWHIQAACGRQPVAFLRRGHFRQQRDGGHGRNPGGELSKGSFRRYLSCRSKEKFLRLFCFVSLFRRGLRFEECIQDRFCCSFLQFEAY